MANKNPFLRPHAKAGSLKAWQLIGKPELKGKLATRIWNRDPARPDCYMSGLYLAPGTAYALETACLCGKPLGYGRLSVLDVPGSNVTRFELAHKACGNKEAARRQAEYTARMLAPDAIAQFARSSWDFGGEPKTRETAVKPQLSRGVCRDCGENIPRGKRGDAFVGSPYCPGCYDAKQIAAAA
jgi:hypothetical protein